jgi:hypothetical protein
MLFPGFPGVATAVGLFALIWLIVYLKSKGQPVIFDPEGKHGEFGKRLLPMYLDITKFRPRNGLAPFDWAGSRKIGARISAQSSFI